MNGLFITLEGMDGSGKTTQIELLKTYFERIGFEVVVTREPGGTIISEAIRNIVLDKQYLEMSHMTEALLYAAARAQHVDQLIRPAVESGKVVICDRFVDSSVVYQGISRGLGEARIRAVNDFAINGLMPNLTILLDLAAKEGINRKKSQQELDRLELEKATFHQKVSDGYRKIADEMPERIIKVDASLSIDEIHGQIVKKIEELLKVTDI